LSKLTVPIGFRAGLEAIHLPGADGSMVSLRELVSVEHSTIERSIYHKNLRRVFMSPATLPARLKALSTPFSR